LVIVSNIKVICISFKLSLILFSIFSSSLENLEVI
jgi:hypothetical protein